MQDHTAPTPVDLLIRNAWIVTMDAERRIFRDGALAVVGDRIHAVGPSAEVAAAVTARETIDGSPAAMSPTMPTGGATSSTG